MNHLLAKFFHLTKEHAPDGLEQTQREAIIDLLSLCRIADHKLLPCEEFVEATELGSFSWESKVPMVVYWAKSLQQTDLVRPSAEARAEFLKSVASRLGASEIQTHAISVCQEMFLADAEFASQKKCCLARSSGLSAGLKNQRQASPPTEDRPTVDGRCKSRS